MIDFKKIINDKGLKQGFVANGIEISEVRLSQYLNNRRNMPDDVKEKLTLFLMEV